MTVYSDFIEITIDGVDVSDYIITYQRDESLCEPGQMFTLTMLRKKPDDSFITIGTADSVVIKEKYGGSPTTVLKGFVTKVEINAEKALMTVHGADKYIMLADYFIPSRLETSGQTVAYWIEYICNDVGLNVQFDVHPYAATQGIGDAEGTPLGMQSALESLKLLERKGTCYTRYDSSSDKILVYRLTTSQPKVNVNSSNLVTIDRATAAKTTRNVVKVWGGYRYDWLTGQEVTYGATARANIPEMVVDQTTVISSPEIRTFTFANIVAQRVLATTSDLDDIAICECVGLYSDVEIGDWIYISISQGEFDYTRERQITSINISVDTNGAKTSFTVGEKCPRVSVSPPPVPIYVTDTKNGVGVSWDAGESFRPSNLGLVTTSELDGKSIAVNNYGRQMAITAAGLHKRFSGLSTWVDVTNLPDPTNESNDLIPLGVTDLEMMKVVDEPLRPYTFHMIASGCHPSGWFRSYVFTTEDYGYNWKTTQMWAPAISGGLLASGYQEHPLAPSGKVFDVWTHDMTASLGNAVTVLVSSPYPPEEDEVPETIYVAEDYSSNQIRLGYWDGSTMTLTQTVTTSGFIVGTRMWSCSTNRDIAYMACVSNDGAASTYAGGQTYVWKTTDGGDSWTEVHNELLIADSSYAFISSYTINFDKSSSETEVRIAFNCFYQTATLDVVYAKARFVNSNPTGSTNYTDDISSTINLEYSSFISGSEYFQHFIHNNNLVTQNFNPAWKNAVIDGVTWAGTGLHGLIRLTSNDAWVDTLQRCVVVKLDFSSKTVVEFNQEAARLGSAVAASPRAVLCSARGTNSVYIYSIGGLALISSSTWSTEGFATVNPYNDFNGFESFSEVFMGYKEFPQYTYRVIDTTVGEQDTDFYPGVIGNLNRVGSCQLSKQFDDAINHWCVSGPTFEGNPDGFCYSEDGVAWTQHWSDNEDLWDFAWRTWE